MNIFWTMGDMKTLYIWKMFSRFQTFRWKNFSGRKNSSRRTPRVDKFGSENGVWGYFHKTCVWLRECNSTVAEKFWEEIWSFWTQKITNNSSRRTPRQDFDHQIEIFFGKKSKMMKIGILINWDVEVVAHSEVVQNTFKTLKLSIFGHISSLK